MEDAGWYSCLAGNSLGMSFRSAWLSVGKYRNNTITIKFPKIILKNHIDCLCSRTGRIAGIGLCTGRKLLELPRLCRLRPGRCLWRDAHHLHLHLHLLQENRQVNFSHFSLFLRNQKSKIRNQKSEIRIYTITTANASATSSWPWKRPTASLPPPRKSSSNSAIHVSTAFTNLW